MIQLAVFPICISRLTPAGFRQTANLSYFRMAGRRKALPIGDAAGYGAGLAFGMPLPLVQ